MSWKVACAADDVHENALKAVEIDGIELVIARIGETYRAYPPVCPHMEEYLESSGLCQGGILTCDRHLWQWDMKTGEPRGPAEKPLLMYEIKNEDGQVLVFLDQELEYEFDDEDDD